MRCPYCLNTSTRVVDKRNHRNFSKRRRECLKCKKRFNTKEESEDVSIRVIKKDETREVFDKIKIKMGVLKALEKRPVGTDKIDKMMSNVLEKISKKGKEVDSFFIGDIVSKELKKIDSVAYIRFASVYRDFRDLSDFNKEIRGLK